MPAHRRLLTGENDERLVLRESVCRDFCKEFGREWLVVDGTQHRAVTAKTVPAWATSAGSGDGVARGCMSASIFTTCFVTILGEAGRRNRTN